MKTAVIIFLVFLGLLAFVEYCHAQQGQGEDCDSWSCSQDCFATGLHGQCDHDNVCRCYNCIYRACRRYCMRAYHSFAQCDEDKCNCLSA